MTVEAAVSQVLDRLSDAQIEKLAKAVDGRTAPGSGVGTAVAGAGPGAAQTVAGLMAKWSATPGMTGSGVAVGLRIGLATRREAAARRSRPVWTGPQASGEQRLTSSVLHELVVGAQERVLLVSFAAYTLAELATDLAAVAARDVEVDVVFESEADSQGSYSGGPGVPFGMVDGLRRWRWPAEQRGVPGAVLHAKLLVVDGRRALVGSANLTQRALTANLEAGVLINDPDVAQSFDQHVRRLMSSGVFVRL